MPVLEYFVFFTRKVREICFVERKRFLWSERTPRKQVHDTFDFSAERKFRTTLFLFYPLWKQQQFAIVLFTTESELWLSYSSPFGRDPTEREPAIAKRNPGQILLRYYSRLFNPRNFHPRPTTRRLFCRMFPSASPFSLRVTFLVSSRPTSF